MFEDQDSIRNRPRHAFLTSGLAYETESAVRVSEAVRVLLSTAAKEEEDATQVLQG